MQNLVHIYLEALQKADYQLMMSLFAADATIKSPLYGECSPVLFYKTLFEDTQQSDVSLKDVFVNADLTGAAFFFTYRWTMADGSFTTFECVDIIEVNENNKITKLQIIYDTVKARTLFEKLKT